MDGGLLEREDQLATLMRAADAASVGDGSVVVVAGEAGIGKSALVRAFAAARPPGLRWLIGWCDDLATARVLGPLRDLAADVATRWRAHWRPGTVARSAMPCCGS